MNSTSRDRTDDFQILFEWRWSKSFALAFSGMGTFVGLFIIYSVIWFEHNGYGNKRTIQVWIRGSSLNDVTSFGVEGQVRPDSSCASLLSILIKLNFINIIECCQSAAEYNVWILEKVSLKILQLWNKLLKFERP